MLASDHPGCCGVAARLPKKPGTQKLAPPSSANAAGAPEAIAIARTPAEIRGAQIARLARDVVCDGVHLVTRYMMSPRPLTALSSQAWTMSKAVAPILQAVHANSSRQLQRNYAKSDRTAL